MRVSLQRRAFLKLTAGGLVLPAVPAFARAAAPVTDLETLHLWETGNTRLSPLAAEGRRIAFCGDVSFGIVTPGEATPLWRRDALEGGGVFSPRFAGAALVITNPKRMTACDPQTGATLWSYYARIQIGVPFIDDGRIHFGDGHEIVSLDLASGKEIWRHAGVPDTLASYAPVTSGGFVLAGPGDGRLYALDRETGAVAWQVDRSGEWQYLRQLRVHEGILVAGSYKEKLFGIATADGAPLWEFNAGNFINSHHVAEGTAYLWSPTGWIYAINAETGAVRWRSLTTDYDETESNWGPLMAELVVSGGLLHALDMKDTLHLLDVADGTQTRRIHLPEPIRHAVLPVPGAGIAFPTMSGKVLFGAET